MIGLEKLLEDILMQERGKELNGSILIVEGKIVKFDLTDSKGQIKMVNKVIELRKMLDFAIAQLELKRENYSEDDGN